MRDPFTINKAKVRDLDFILIERHYEKLKGSLRYLGLPASTLIELISWSEWFSHFSAIERGKKGEEYIEQHKLMLTAMQYNLADKLALLRGEMDEILNTGKDEFDNPLQYPFDVISLDYSGGLVYKDSSGKSKRTESINNLLLRQADHNKDFLLFISTNLDYIDAGEIKRVLSDIKAEFTKMGVNGDATLNAIVNHELDEIRLKIYVPYIIKYLSAKSYKCEFQKPVFYSGNKRTRMVHFSFWLKRTSNYIAGKPNFSDLVTLLNLPVLVCENGKAKETDFGIPKIQL